MSPTTRDAVKYSGIITGIPFMTIAGFYLGDIVGKSLGTPWSEILPIVGGLSFFLLVVFELALLEMKSRDSKKSPESSELEEKKIDLPDYQPGVNIRATFKFDEEKKAADEEKH